MTDAAGVIRAAADAIVAEASGRDASLAGARVTAIHWATVELDRAEAELARAFGGPLHARPGIRDARLGAAVRIARPFGPDPAPELRLVEPDTEGRLAGLLARHGEGVIAADVELAGGTRRLELTSGRGARSPKAPSGRPPAVAS